MKATATAQPSQAQQPPSPAQMWENSLLRITDTRKADTEVLYCNGAVIGTLGNFSASTGKAKSRKTFNVTALTAAALKNGEVMAYIGELPEEKRTILYIDTEQSAYHCQRVIWRILRLAGLPVDSHPDNFKFASLRPFTPEQRLAMSKEEGLLSFGGHLEFLRQMLFRISGVTFVFSCIIFFFKTRTFDILLAPSESSFITYRIAESLINYVDPVFRFDSFRIELIATDLSSQFVTHLTTSIYLGLLCASPLIIYELFRFVSPALLENERRYSTKVVVSIYALFILGVLMSYYVLFPISFRFLGTYSVADKVHSMITLDSYISTFTSLTLLMGIVFQLPVIAFILGKMGILQSSQMAKYRKHAFILIMLVAAIITPPDIFTLILVAVPLHLLYELSTIIAKRYECCQG